MNRRVFASLLIVLVTAPAVYSLRADAPSYVVEDLGTIGGFAPNVTGMNASGQVSGYVSRPDGLRAVRYTDGAGWAYLPGLESVYSVANGINANGDMTGYYLAPAGLRAFRYVDGIGVAMIPALPGGSFSIGFAISANGDVVGYGNTTAGNRAWRASPGLTPIVPASLVSTPSMACGVNAAGQMVGSFTKAGFQHAFRLELDQSLTDVGTLEGPSSTSTACAVDADGRVGGRSGLGSASHAFLFTGSAPFDVDAFNSTFSNITAIASSVSVGTFTWSTVTGEPHAFVYTDDGGATDLNTRIPSGSGWILSEATAVNSNGQIAGHGLVGGSPRAFRLTPGAPPDTTPPVFTSLTATPSRVWPPNDALVGVTVAVVATDDSGETPACALSAITSSGTTADDYTITGQYSARVRAVGGRTYSLRVTCSDAALNRRDASVNVVVPPDTTAPVIAALSASPDHVWPPNGKMVSVTLSVTATDDVDATPKCALGSITGAPAADAVVTGAFTASVRAEKDAVYTLNVGCADRAGNTSQGSVRVAVSKDPPTSASTSKKR